MSFINLSNDIEFKSRWPYIWSKLEPVLLQKQRDYARAHKGEHAQIGQFTEFLSELMDELNEIDRGVIAPPKIIRQRLHNSDHKQ